MILLNRVDTIFFSIVFAAIVIMGLVYLAGYLYNRYRKEKDDIIHDNKDEIKDNNPDEKKE